MISVAIDTVLSSFISDPPLAERYIEAEVSPDDGEGRDHVTIVPPAAASPGL